MLISNVSCNGLAMLTAGLFLTSAAASAQTSLPAPLPPNNGCNGTCLNWNHLPMGSYVVDGVAYFGDFFLGCDEERPYNTQLDWRSTTLWYYYVPARICEPHPWME